MGKMNQLFVVEGNRRKSTQECISVECQPPTLLSIPGGTGGKSLYGEVQVNKFEPVWGGPGRRLGPGVFCMVREGGWNQNGGRGGRGPK